jgi:hypothetical protein
MLFEIVDAHEDSCITQDQIEKLVRERVFGNQLWGIIFFFLILSFLVILRFLPNSEADNGRN